MKQIIFWLSFGASMAALPGLAGDSASNWSGKAQLGYLAASGNTESETITAGFEVKNVYQRWTNLLAASGYMSSEDDENNAERYAALFKSQYAFTEFDYVFGAIDWKKDNFGAYEQQISETIGYGRRIINQERQILNLELGAGARQSELSDGTKEDEIIGRLGLDYDFKFGTDNKNSFEQDILVEGGGENVFVKSISALRMPLGGGVGLKLAYTVEHNTEVPTGTEKTDRYASVNLDYVFD